MNQPLRHFCSLPQNSTVDSKIRKAKNEIIRNRRKRISLRDKELSKASTTAQKFKIRHEFEENEKKHRLEARALMQGSDIIQQTVVQKPKLQEQDDPFAAQVRVVDGNIVMDDFSIVVSNRNPNIPTGPIIEESQFRYYNQFDFQKNSNCNGRRWRQDEEDVFYEGLSAWGQNFEAIARMLPGKSRQNIKNKYKKELANFPERVKAALLSCKPITITEYSAATGIEESKFHDPLPKLEIEEGTYFAPQIEHFEEIIQSEEELMAFSDEE